MPIIDTRREQMFPTFTPQQIEMAQRFASGEPQRFAPGASLYDVGERDVPSWLVLEGRSSPADAAGSAPSSRSSATAPGT